MVHPRPPVDCLTKRLRLSPLGLADLPDLARLRADPRVMEHWDWPTDDSPEVTRSILEGLLDEVATGKARHWAIRQRLDRGFVGVADLSDIAPLAQADVGFMLMPEYWGQGLGAELLDWMLAQASALGLHRLHARIHGANLRSARLLARAGFTIDDRRAGLEVRPGVLRDCVWLSIALGDREDRA